MTDKIAAEFTTEDLENLLALYSQVDPGPCRVCDGELTVQAMGPGSFVAWAHAVPEGTSYREWGDHYRDSRVESYKPTDSRVQLLVEEVLRLRKEGK